MQWVIFFIFLFLQKVFHVQRTGPSGRWCQETAKEESKAHFCFSCHFFPVGKMMEFLWKCTLCLCERQKHHQSTCLLNSLSNHASYTISVLWALLVGMTASPELVTLEQGEERKIRLGPVRHFSSWQETSASSTLRKAHLPPAKLQT